MKKALCVITALTILGSFLLCGCNKPATTPETENKKPAEPVDVSFYDEVLQDYETIVRFRLADTFEENWNNDCLPTISTALTVAIQENPDVEWPNTIVEMTSGLDAPTLSSFGYILKDMNNDDFPELFLVREDYAIIAIFTNKNGKLVLLDTFWPKHECIITNEEELFIRTSSGATYTDYTIQALTVQGNLLKTKQFGFEEISAEGEPLYYEVVNDVKQPVGEDRFGELLRENPFEFGSDWLSQKVNLLGQSAETIWYQDMKFYATTKWSLVVAETDTLFYYLIEDGVYQYEKRTEESTKIIPELAYGLFILDNKLYYHTEHQVKCMDLHTKEISVLWDGTALTRTDAYYYNSVCDFALYNEYLYIAGTGTSVMRVNLGNGTAEQFLWDYGGMVLLGNDCYYLDHAERTFSLYHKTCDSKESTLLRGKGESYPDEMQIDGVAGVGDAVAYSVRDTADVYLYHPDGNDEKIFDGENVWVSFASRRPGEELYFYTTDGQELRLYEYSPSMGVRLLTCFDTTVRICDIAITESMVFWQLKNENTVKCIERD